MVDKDGNVTDTETDIQEVKYEVDKDGNVVDPPVETFESFIFFDENGNDVLKGLDEANRADTLNKISGEYYTDKDGNVMYDKDGNLSKEVTTYFDPSGNVVTKEEAIEQITLQHSSMSQYNKEVYPATMTRDAIMGYVRDASGNITEEINDTNKIVERLEEVRKSLGYDATPVTDSNGNVVKDEHGNVVRTGYDSAKYTTTVPAGFDVSQQAILGTHNNQMTLNRAVTDNAQNINTSCTISGGIPQNQKLKIKPTSEIWIVLDNVTVDTSEIIIDESGGGKVNFLIKGKLSTNNGKIRTKNIKEGVVVRASDTMNVTFYGEENSSIEMTNNSLICGAAKAPFTSLSQKCSGSIMIQYVDEYGNMAPKNPAWIGNALVKEVVDAQNSFALCYTKAGSSAPNYIDTEVGLWEINYFEQY